MEFGAQRLEFLRVVEQRLRAAWDTEYKRLTREIEEVIAQLTLAREWAVRAERRCQQLEPC